jgi:hypothetical protein
MDTIPIVGSFMASAMEYVAYCMPRKSVKSAMVYNLLELIMFIVMLFAIFINNNYLECRLILNAIKVT